MLNIEKNASSILPPDFSHGNTAIEKLYQAYSPEWVENAVFIVESEAGVIWAAFNDYFLSMGEGLCPAVLERRSIIHLVVGSKKTHSFPGAIEIQCSRERMSELEIGALSVWREGEASLKEDALSLVCLCASLGINEIQ